jgi:tricarballylate dehydrogenase
MTSVSLPECDVVVVGGGNAGLCAAISAAERGARVTVLESAPHAFRGGNSRHTRNLRCMHDGPVETLTGTYGETEFWDDLAQVTRGHTDEALARMVIAGSGAALPWMRTHGVRFQPALSGTLHLSRTNAFFLGGGKALLNAYYRSAARLGVRVEYDAEVTAIAADGGRVSGVTVTKDGRSVSLAARALVAAAGGFQADVDWLRRIWGPAADNFLIRGTPYDTGRVLRLLLDAGARPVGDPAQCHAVAIDARAPKFDGGIVTRVDSVSLGIVVNRDAVRFYDEGEDFWPKRYAIWGRLIAAQPGQIAYSIVDDQAAGAYMPPVFPPIEAATIHELAAALSLDADALARTVAAFNAAVRPGRFDHTSLDDCRTAGIEPAKTHWARPIEKPPFRAYPLRPGITFTYYGVSVDASSRIVMADGTPASNMFAAGEIMSGNVLGQGYLAGLGMAIGTVFGRTAGTQAAATALADGR